MRNRQFESARRKLRAMLDTLEWVQDRHNVRPGHAHFKCIVEPCIERIVIAEQRGAVEQCIELLRGQA